MKYLYIVLIVLAVAAAGWGLWWTYFAPCEFIVDLTTAINALLRDVPVRCLDYFQG